MCGLNSVQLGRPRYSQTVRRARGSNSMTRENGFLSILQPFANKRTSKIVDPPNGRLPPLTAEAQKTAAMDQAFRLALLQSTATCKDKLLACAGGHYEPAASP